MKKLERDVKLNQKKKKKKKKKIVPIDGAFDSTVRKAIQQHVVNYTERNRALKTSRSSTASNPNPRRIDLCLTSGHEQVFVVLNVSINNIQGYIFSVS